ncbi:MAG: helix-turn-helix transcriptional regulator, partial [Eggerthella lenta]|nr:helix-turn-helix transcriptional regulator [Eggerthella lenta]
YGLSLLTLLAFAAIYPLAIVLVVALRRAHPQDASHATASEREAGAPSAGSVPTVDDALGAGVDAVAARFELTPREREILGYLARGRSARFIAETLIISENTVWAHIKRVYAKTGVHSKQELMSVVERQGRNGKDG